MKGKKQAIYHRTGHKPKPFFIAGENGDGTVDLADESGEVRISSCRVAAVPEDGCCTKGGGSPKPPTPAKKDEAKKDEAKKDEAEKDEAEKDAPEKAETSDQPK